MGIKTCTAKHLFCFGFVSEKPPHHMGIKTARVKIVSISFPLKNLPTTWGLRRNVSITIDLVGLALKNLPTTWGLRLFDFAYHLDFFKTLKNLPTTWGLRLLYIYQCLNGTFTLKNLPTTWGLRLRLFTSDKACLSSEKPPHHMGIKTRYRLHIALSHKYSEKPPHHMGIKTCC